MALNDIFQVNVKWRDQDMKTMENVLFYRYKSVVGLGGGSAAENLANTYNSVMVTGSLPSTPQSIVYTAVAVKNLFDGSEQFELPILRAGTRSLVGADNNPMPSHDAVKVVLATDNGLVKKGRKMLAGLLEGDQVGGIIASIPYATWAIRAALFVVELVDSVVLGTKSFEPVVVKRIREGVPGAYTYRLPENQFEAVYGVIQNAVLSAIITTQNSRKD